MKKYILFLLLFFLFFTVNGFAEEDTVCELKYNEQIFRTIDLNKSIKGEPTLLDAVVVCKDSDSAIIKAEGRFLRGKFLRIYNEIKDLDVEVGEHLSIPVTIKTLKPYNKR